jgi:hypothetical protein
LHKALERLSRNAGLCERRFESLQLRGGDAEGLRHERELLSGFVLTVDELNDRRRDAGEASRDGAERRTDGAHAERALLGRFA